MAPEEALRQLWLWNAIGSCVSRDQLCHATGREYLFEGDVRALTERDHFQRFKRGVLLSSSHNGFIQASCGFRRHGMQHDLFVMFYTACLWSDFANNTCDCTYIVRIVDCFVCVLLSMFSLWLSFSLMLIVNLIPGVSRRLPQLSCV